MEPEILKQLSQSYITEPFTFGELNVMIETLITGGSIKTLPKNDDSTDELLEELKEIIKNKKE